MSVASDALQRQQRVNYFTLPAGLREVSVVGTEITFKAYFDYAHMSRDKDKGNVTQQTRSPHLTYLADIVELEERETRVIVNEQEFTVYRVTTDRTPETFQSEAWLVEVEES